MRRLRRKRWAAAAEEAVVALMQQTEIWPCNGRERREDDIECAREQHRATCSNRLV